GAYFWRITRQDWENVPQGDAYPETRRLYWYIWLFYALAALLGGGGSLVSWLVGTLLAQAEPALLANALSALLVGGALWFLLRRLIRRSLAEPAERESLLRLSTLFLITFISLAGLLLATWIVLSESLEALFSGGIDLRQFLLDMAGPLSVGIPTGLMFAYYRRLLGLEMHSQPISLEAALRVEPEAGDGNPAAQKQKRAALTRLYFYTLALIGLTLALSGLQGALRIFIEMVTIGFSDWQSELSLGLAAALIGAPLWFYAWRPLQKEAGRSGEAGDHTRRSPIRRGYLYLVLFAGVIGAMFSAGWLLYQAIGWLLGAPAFDLAFGLLNGAKNLLLYTVVLLYHGRVLGQDNRQAERALAQRHAQYSVLLLSPDPPADESGRQPNGAFTREIVAALQRYTPALPVAVHPYRAGIPDETLSAARAVIIPGELLARQSEAWRLWLQAFPGELLVAPTETPRWRWIDGGGAPPALARRIAALVRRLAEGEGGVNDFNYSPWLPLAYTAAGVFVLALILIILVAGLSMFQL
ncbi:MAG TPA: DUF5671 domain-containing protein, partial [Anaerolineales bacterium]|nr:DUF5671 domain-containing protein [Anaerolineales bacterium]